MNNINGNLPPDPLDPLDPLNPADPGETQRVEETQINTPAGDQYQQVDATRVNPISGEQTRVVQTSHTTPPLPSTPPLYDQQAVVRSVSGTGRLRWQYMFAALAALLLII